MVVKMVSGYTHSLRLPSYQSALSMASQVKSYPVIQQTTPAETKTLYCAVALYSAPFPTDPQKPRILTHHTMGYSAAASFRRSVFSPLSPTR